MDKMTAQDKEFISALIDSVKKEINSMKEMFGKDLVSIKEHFQIKLESISNNQTKFREDIIDLYEKYRSAIDKISCTENKVLIIEQEVKYHKENHTETKNDKRFIIPLVISILFGLAGLIFGLVK